MKREMISIIVPVHNEILNLPALYEALATELQSLKLRFELVFVDDGSSDESVPYIEKLMSTDKHVRLIELARNFGKEPAVTAGLHHAKGDAALIMDADLQHPPRLIKDFVAEWRKGADVVVGVKRYARDVGWFKRLTSAWFYRIFQMVAQTEVTPHASDYRLLDRKVIDAFNSLTERNRITRGLIDWLGFKRTYIHFEQPGRHDGTPSYTYRRLVALAVNAFTSYSMVPLKLAGYLGWAILLTATPAGILLYINEYLLGDPLRLNITGTAMLAMLLLVLVGIVLACLGLVALYIANIHDEVTNRPLYVVRRQAQTLDIDEEAAE